MADDMITLPLFPAEAELLRRMVLAERNEADAEWQAVKAINPKRAGQLDSVKRGLQTLADKFAVMAGTPMILSGRYYAGYEDGQRTFPTDGIGIDAVNAHAFVVKG